MWECQGNAKPYETAPRPCRRMAYDSSSQSHIKSTSKNWTRQSRCLICARGLGQESIVYKSDTLLFQHIAKRHCGRRCADVLLRGPICFDHNSLYTGTKESYDIFFPLECPEHPLQDEPTPSSPSMNAI